MKLRPPKILTGDFETKSELSIKVGAWVYSRHPSTDVTMFSWEIDGVIYTWHPAFPSIGIPERGRADLERLFDLILSTTEHELVFEAHNAFFEQCIWLNICVARYGWPELPVRRWRCSAAKASVHGLPRALEDLCRVLGTKQQKDMEGSRIMKKWAKPKKDGTWHEDAEELIRYVEYNRQDVRAEHNASRMLPELDTREQELWFMDQEVNFRGVLCDRELAVKALALVDELKARNNERFYELTGLKSCSQRKAFQDFCENFGLELPNTQGETLRRTLLRTDLDPELRECLKLVYENNRTSTAKYKTALAVMDPDDDRIRGSIMYAGAERTLRWAGRLIQPHNFPRGHIKDMEAACDFVLAEDLDTIITFMDSYSKRDSEGRVIGFKDIMEFLSHCLRGLIIAESGRRLCVSDFAAIEARVVLWLGGETEALALLLSGACIYCDMATDIYSYECNKVDHPAERQVGKQAILGLGFGMGDGKFVATCARYDIIIQDEFGKKVVGIYRKKYPGVVQLWSDQENAAIQAMLVASGRDLAQADFDPFPVVDGWTVAGKLAWRRQGRFLRCRLPSGRYNVYPFPIVKMGKVYYFKLMTSQGVERYMAVQNPDNEPWSTSRILRKAKAKADKFPDCKLMNVEPREREKYSLRYMGIDPETKKWGEVHTYGGKLVENIVQGTARDLLADAMLRAHRSETYDVTLSIHDEVMAEVDDWLCDQHEFDGIMMEVPDWADGCPISAEGFNSFRYKK